MEMTQKNRLTKNVKQNQTEKRFRKNACIKHLLGQARNGKQLIEQTRNVTENTCKQGNAEHGLQR